MKHAPRGPIKSHGDLMDAPRRMDTSYTPCTATSKQSGVRCKRRPIPGGHVCVMHGGGSPLVQFKAQERLKSLQPKAITVLESLLDREEFPTVQIAAVKDVLDRTEGKAGETQTLTIIGQINIVDVIRQRSRRRLAIDENIEQSDPAPQAGDTL